MIGLRVKASLCALVVITLAACGGKTTSNQPTVPQKAVAAGAERWDGAALLLPEDSPAVVVTRLDDLLDAIGRFKRWIVAEPAMFGDDGDAITRRINQGWMAAVAYLGVDPLSPAAWSERGVDPDVPMYFGLYPISRDERRYVGAVENILREELGIPPGGPLASSMNILTDAGGRLQEGTHAQIERLELGARSTGGLRAVVGVSSADEFLITARSFAEGMGFRVFPEALVEGREGHWFWSDGELVPAMSIRFVDDRAIFDIVVPSLGGHHPAPLSRETLESARDQLATVVQLPSGRSLAPAPVGASMVALSVAQSAYADHVRLFGYREHLAELRKVSTERRDAELLPRFLETAAEAEAWAAAGDVLTGSVFEVSAAPRSGRIGVASMSMFGARSLPTLDSARALPTLNLAEQSVGLGVQLGALRSEPWGAWFGKDAIADMRELELDPIAGRGAPAVLRSVGVAIALAGHPQYSNAVGGELGSVLKELEAVDHLEIVSAGPDIMDLGRNQLFCSVVMRQGSTPSEVTDVQHVLESAIVAADGDSLQLDLPTLKPGGLATTPFGASAVHQQLINGSETQVLLSGVGVTAEALTEQASTLEVPQTVRSVLHAHVEPVALLPWVRQLGEKILDPLDPDILAQRIGAVEMRYGANPDAAGRAVTMSVELLEPPKLP